jgi:hypothetical protein
VKEMADQNDAENVVEQAEDDFATDATRRGFSTSRSKISAPSRKRSSIRRRRRSVCGAPSDAYRKLIKESR